MNVKEEWKPLLYGDLDLTDKIEVSNMGRLRNISSKKILSTRIHETGYEVVCISLGSRDRKKVIKVHRAVAFMFVQGYKHELVVNHKDLNKTNNNAHNLEWVTKRENTMHAFNHDRVLDQFKPKKIMCNQTKVVFDSLTSAATWCGLKASSPIFNYLRGKAKSAGKHPITKERLTWTLVD